MLLALIPLAAAQSFAAGVPAFDPRRHKQAIAGPASQVLVLGTTHLSGLPKSFDPELLKPLIDRLAKFRPDIVTIESLSGEECDTLHRFSAEHGADTWETYCFDTAPVEKATGLSAPAASAEVERTLAAWPASPTAAQRRHLAMLFLAAGDRSSATVQWLRLPVADRRAGDGLTPDMVGIIEAKGKAPNENTAIAARLAAQLGLERVYPADDHTADWAIDEASPEGKAYGEAIQAAWSQNKSPAWRTEQTKLEHRLQSGADVLKLYRLLNTPAYQRGAIASDMGRNAAYRSARLYGRQYVAWWETRNLRMVANIREAMARKPGARVLSVVGATHKGYFDAYLDMMQDVRIVDAMQFLK